MGTRSGDSTLVIEFIHTQTRIHILLPW